jgi:O-antigen/teichoic acid export membrane protein
VAWTATILVYLILLGRCLPPSTGSVDGKELTRRLVRMGVTLMASGASVTIYTHSDKLILGYFRSVAEVGQYAIARNIVEVSLFPTFAAVMVLRPALASRFARGERRSCGRTMVHAFRFGLALGGLYFLLYRHYFPALLVWIYGGSYSDAASLLSPFLGVVLARGLGAAILPGLLAAERTGWYALLTAFSALANFLLDLWAIPRWGARGAVFATLTSYGFLVLIGWWLLAKLFSMPVERGDWKRLGGIGMAVLVSLGAVRWLGEGATGAGALWRAALVAALYVGTLWLFGGLLPPGEEDRKGRMA